MINQPNNETFISLNYPELRVDNLQITKDDLGKKSIQANFIGKPNEPNVIYSKTDIPQKYQAKQLFILGKLHKDLDIDYDGELIIKNQSQTTQQTIYTIFLLKTNTLVQPLVKTLTPQLTDPETLTSLAINDMIDLTKPTKYIVYNSANTTIIINTNVINVGFDLKDYSTNSSITDLLMSTKMSTKMSTSIVEMNNQDQSINKSVNKSYEGFSINTDGKLTNDAKDGDYMICDNLPVGSAEELSYVIPGNSAVVDSITANSAFTSIMYIVICFCLFLAIYVLSPIGYMWLFNGYLFESLKNIYSTTILSHTPITFATNMDDPNTRLFNSQMFHTPFELLIAIIVGILFIILVSVGLAPATKSAPTSAAGLLIGFCYLIGWLSARNNTEVNKMLIDYAAVGGNTNANRF